jgi:RNA polymerase-binding protein DksA
MSDRPGCRDGAEELRMEPRDDCRGTMTTKPENHGSLSKDQMQLIKESLERKRSEILHSQRTQLSELYSPDKHHLADLEEMASDTMDTDSLCALVDLSSSTLSEVEAALEKIQQGTYGTCEICDEPIHPDRLEFLPFASLCVTCQRKKEKQKLAEEREE